MVRVTDHFLGCIVYLCVEDAARGGPVPRGTAFTVSVPDGNSPDVVHCYLITARHNLESARTDRIIVRVNTEQGFRDVDTDRTRWHMHDSADVAALLFSAERVAEQVPLSRFVGADFLYHFRFSDAGENFPVSVGTELFFVGLFVQRPGIGRNLPIARFGHVARMPSEIVLTAGDGTEFRQLAYLAECRSWGGHSGSPAFCIFHRTEGGETLRHIALLGLVSAHDDIETRVTSPNRAGAFTAAVNSGIAIVTPAEFVSELLSRSDVVEERRAVYR